MTYKLKIMILNEEGGFDSFQDLWLNLDMVDGFFIPGELHGYQCVNLLYSGDFYTVLQEKHLTDYLYKYFVHKAIEK